MRIHSTRCGCGCVLALTVTICLSRSECLSLTAKQGVILGLERNAALKYVSTNYSVTKIGTIQVVMIEPLDFPGGPAAARNDVIFHLIGTYVCMNTYLSHIHTHRPPPR
jgi:hypothetical protein